MHLGIDIGSLSLSGVLLDDAQQIRHRFYDFHHGKPGACLEKLQSELDLHRPGRVMLTSSSRLSIPGIPYLDIQSALVRANQWRDNPSPWILHVGAEKFYLIRCTPDGRYESSRTNTSCAAGTGSFLDQQSRRLGIFGIKDFCDLAGANEEPAPAIASRCAVFAKTDLIHAQQEGYSTAAICDGLCRGLARNLADTLFQEFPSGQEILFTGGVSLNPVVSAALQEILQSPLIVMPESHLAGALGAALMTFNHTHTAHKTREEPGQHAVFSDNADQPYGDLPQALQQLTGHYRKPLKERHYFYPELKPAVSRYPDFSQGRQWVVSPPIEGFAADVQIEMFDEHAAEEIYLGFDIGSTSTKAMVSNHLGEPLLGYYTYTSGKPIEAVFSILALLENHLQSRQWQPVILGAGTTGSGRKLIGKIIGADLVLDEITAHARSATWLDPKVDTIIEIGGQDAKFTMLENGEVVFSQMNSVCAAGTGSFIEEQALKLDVPLEDYTRRVRGHRAPLTSDRCTVFMERDLNNLINRGYAVEELLAAVLHSVRENYLKKVATGGTIGQHVCFQGATGKNHALVAVFEEKLGKPIYVSRYCHLTGAMGINLVMKQEGFRQSGFRGLSLYRNDTRVRTEICELCSNHCKLTIARFGDEDAAYGFLCGRDYHTRRYIPRDPEGFDLIREHRKHFRVPVLKSGAKTRIGLPSSLHLLDEEVFWKHFFRALGVEVISSRPDKTRLREGKNLAGAEFCAPVESMYGHVKDLLGRVEHIFLPVYIESRKHTRKRELNYCYYTQFSPSIVTQIAATPDQHRFVVPEIDLRLSPRQYLATLHQSLRSSILPGLSMWAVRKAWREAHAFVASREKEWKYKFLQLFRPHKGISVVLLGRPYVLLSEEMNKGIPSYFNAHDVPCYFQDMLPGRSLHEYPADRPEMHIPWHFAAEIMDAAHYTAQTPGLYPVLVTAFKCAPDSFIIEFFKKILSSAGKPYLILQIDEHDSAVGYETRIEAALRSFRNHARSAGMKKQPPPERILSKLDRELNGKTLLVPNWDAYSQRFLIAMLRRQGIDARLLEPDETSMRKSMVHNTGQCIPINIIAQDFIDYVEKYALDPARTMLWMSKSFITCNFRLYPEYLKQLLVNYGNGMEQAGIYLGQIANFDISVRVAVQSYFVYMLGGLIRKMGCMIRPYEQNKGETDRVTGEVLELVESAFAGKTDLESAVRDMARKFNNIPRKDINDKPEVAIFGDFYVRDHEVVNQGLIRFIEEAGGMVVTTPYHDFVKLTSGNIIRRAVKRGDLQHALLTRILISLLDVLDRRYYKHLESILGMKEKINARSLEKHLESFHVKPHQSGESFDNLLKIFHILEYHPSLSLFVQTNPAFCCPALITEAMTRRIREITGVPVATITYDGTAESKNELILPYLVAAQEKQAL